MLIFLPDVIENFATRVQVGQVGGLEKEILGISACIENCEHLKYFRNVGCVVTNHNKDDETKQNIKAWHTNLSASAFSLQHDNIMD